MDAFIRHSVSKNARLGVQRRAVRQFNCYGSPGRACGQSFVMPFQSDPDPGKDFQVRFLCLCWWRKCRLKLVTAVTNHWWRIHLSRLTADNLCA